MKPFKLPKTFLAGVATASAQIEGGDDNHTWHRWSGDKNNIDDGTNCHIADDHWNRIDEDTAIMKKMNIKVYRMSLEWSRIEPEEGKFSKDAMDHYRDEIIKLQKAGIEPLVTLHHFSNPLWMEDSGGWTGKNAIERFEKYTEFVVKNIGDIVSQWVTINEPNIYLFFGYVDGTWPPGKNSILQYFKGARNMIKAHITAYRKIHKVRKEIGFDDTMVGASHHLRVLEPEKNKLTERVVAGWLDRLFQNMFIEGMATGKFIFPLGRGYPMGKGIFQDFSGINYYTRDIINFTVFNPAELFSKRKVKEGAPVNDLGWEIYPEGIYIICKKMFDKYKIPIYITENGTCDSKDSFRTKYTIEHLAEIKRAIDDGIDVQRYYHWTFMDNFEWAEGLSARFGLVEVDFETQKRSVRKSGKFYAEFCKGNEVTGKMIEKYYKGD